VVATRVEACGQATARTVDDVCGADGVAVQRPDATTVADTVDGSDAAEVQPQRVSASASG
jgi:hypothetical protein